jgi:MFS family permease
MYYNKLRRRLAYGLSRELWLVQVGIFLNTFGWGAVLPFEVIYLHDGRGFSLSLAGLVVGTLTGAAVVTAPLAGPLIDRFGARTIAAGAGLALAAGYAGLGFAQTPEAALAAAALAGGGNGALAPSQSTLLAALAPSELRHRATAVSRVCTNVGFGLGGAAGGFVAATGLNGLIALFLVNAASYLVYVGVLLAVVREAPRAEHVPGGYRFVLRDRAFLHLALTNVAIIAVGWGVLPWLVPPYAKSEVGIDAQLIGLLMLANAATVVVAQVPIAKAAEGRRRVVMIALGSVIFAGSCLLIFVAGTAPTAAYLTLVLASVAIGVGECFHSTALMPLVAELAPAGLLGRYMATIGLSWWIGLAVAPTAGAQLLSLSPAAAFLGAGAVGVAAAVSALTLEHELPAQARVTPQPG